MPNAQHYFAAMPADETQHGLLFRYSAAIPANQTPLSDRIKLYIGFIIGFSCQAYYHRISAQQQALHVVDYAKQNLVQLQAVTDRKLFGSNTLVNRFIKP